MYIYPTISITNPSPKQAKNLFTPSRTSVKSNQKWKSPWTAKTSSQPSRPSISQLISAEEAHDRKENLRRIVFPLASGSSLELAATSTALDPCEVRVSGRRYRAILTTPRNVEIPGKRERLRGRKGERRKYRERERSRIVYRHLSDQRRLLSSYRRPSSVLRLSFSSSWKHNGETGSCRMQPRVWVLVAGTHFRWDKERQGDAARTRPQYTACKLVGMRVHVSSNNVLLAGVKKQRGWKHVAGAREMRKTRVGMSDA